MAHEKYPSPVTDICDAEDESTPREETSSTTEPSDEQLGKEIMARIDAGDKAKERADNMFISAGQMLIKGHLEK